ncbi:MAG: alpha/beta fold hydrolase [Actinobacteria bacterium]|nr:alpha/beta fold hydrolase [Actinomycetota bacterium]
MREIEGPPGAPALMLFHGWTATADLNWFTSYELLGRHFRVVAMDMRGHGRGIRSNKPFRLSDCADDAAILADHLGIATFIPVGYSMGGTIAQLMWKRHEQRVRGLVLAATSGHFVSRREERAGFLALQGIGALARVTPRAVREWVSDRLYLSRKTMTWEPWAAQQLADHDWRAVLEAGAALGRYDSREWLGDVDVPTAVVMTTQDQVVSPRRQRVLAESIRASHVLEVPANHDAVFARADEFVPVLVEACLRVHRDALDRSGTP